MTFKRGVTKAQEAEYEALENNDKKADYRKTWFENAKTEIEKKCVKVESHSKVDKTKGVFRNFAQLVIKQGWEHCAHINSATRRFT